MINVKIIMVEYDRRRGHWRIGQELDDGSGQVRRELHLIPPRAFVNHPAEYGLDPRDSRTVLDWLLHSRFADHQDPSTEGMSPFCPYRNAPETAWAAHKASTVDVKTRVSITDPDGLLEQIHQAHDPHPVQIIEALERVQRDRGHVVSIERQHRG